MRLGRQRQKKQDKRTQALYDALKEAFPTVAKKSKSEVVYLANPVSIRVRIIDDGFEGKETAARELLVKKALKDVSPEIVADITMLLLLTTEEAKDPINLSNAEFDDPGRSML